MFKLVLFLVLTRTQSVTHDVRLCTALYGIMVFVLGLLSLSATHGSFPGIVIGTLIETAIAFGYFNLLEKFDGTLLWWLVAMLGIALLMAPTFLSLIPPF